MNNSGEPTGTKANNFDENTNLQNHKSSNYAYSLLLLSAGATIQFDLFGLAYFVLFILHSFAYYSLRSNFNPQQILVQDEPLDVIKSNRRNKINIRGCFAYLLCFVTGISFTMVTFGQFLQYLQKIGNGIEKENNTYINIINFFVRISSNFLQETLSPKYDSLFTFLYNMLLFLASLLLLKTRKYEEMEAAHRTQESKRTNDTIEQVETMKVYQIQRAVQLIKDYKFKSALVIQLEIIVLAVITSLSASILVFPYTFVFIVLGIILACSSQMQTLRMFSNKLNLILLAILLIDLPTKYVIKGSNIIEEEDKSNVIYQIAGLLSNWGTYTDFYLKILLFLIECQKVQYSFDYQELYNQIKQCHKDLPEVQRFLKKRKSFKKRIFQPISQFMFSSLALLFLISHPSVLFFFLMPIVIFGFFMNPQKYSKIAIFTVFLFGLYILCGFAANITDLVLTNSDLKEKYFTMMLKIFGLKRDSEMFTETFPFSYDLLVYILMANFASFLNKIRVQNAQESERFSYQMRGSIDEDILTIPDDQIEKSHKASKTPSVIDHPVRATSAFEEQKEIVVEDQEEEENKSLISTRKAQREEREIIQRLQNISYDETFRGRLRRSFYKIYVKFKKVVDFISELTIIHSAKFALLGLFCVSVSYPNLINCVLFFQFLGFSLAKFENVQRYWNILIIYNSIVINAFYGYDVFAPNGIQGVDNDTLDFIGISHREDNLRKYIPYVILMAVLVISHYVFTSNKYQEFLQHYAFYQSREYSNQLARDGNIKSQYTLGLSDSVSKFFFKSSIYILMITLFLECLYLPVSLLNVVLLILMVVILHKYFNNQYQLGMYQSLHATLRVLRLVSCIFILLKYLFQFKDWASKVQMTGEEARKIYENLPLIEKLLGIENSYVGFKLFSLALVIVLTNLQLKFLNHQYLTNIILEEQEPWNRLTFINLKNATKCQIYMHNFKIYLLFTLQHVLIPVPILLLMEASYRIKSILGLILLFLGLLVLKGQYAQYWKYSHSPIGKITAITMVVIYSSQFLFIMNVADKDLLEWLGVQQEEKDRVLFMQLLPMFLILLACILQKLSLKLQTLFTQTVSDNEYKSIQDKQSDLTLEELEMSSVYIFEEPIRKCLQFRDQHLKISFFNYGLILMETILLIIMMWKQSLISIIYLLFFVFLIRKNYFPKTFEENDLQREKRIQVANLITKLILFVTFIMIFEFLMLLKFDFILDIEAVKQKFVSYLCFVDNQECTSDWEQWLQISHFLPEFILLDYILLLFSYLNLLFTKNSILQDEGICNKLPVINDSQDFYSSPTYSKYQMALHQLIFGGFPYMLIISTLVVASIFHETGMSDLVSMVYLFFAFYYVINFRKFYTQGRQFIQNMRKYNCFVLFSVLIFQCPFFICPAVSEDKNDTYLNKRECSLYSQINRSKNYYGKDTLMALYIVITQSLGLFKIRSVQFDLIFIIIMTEIQCQVFDHPYFQTYVLEHMRLEKETDGRLRAFKFVEETHLETVWAYQAIKKEIKILHQRLKRIMKTIRSNEYSKHLLAEDDAESQNQVDLSEESSLLSEEEGEQTPIQFQGSEIEDLLENYKIDVEMFALQKMYNVNAPVISHKQLTLSLKKYITQKYPQVYDFNQEQLQDIEEEMEKIFYEQQKKSLYKNRIDLYNKEGTGLNFAIQSGAIERLKDGEFAFYSHLILNKQQKNKSQSSSDGSEINQKEFEIMEEEKEQQLFKEWYKKTCDGNLLQKLDFYTRMNIWNKLINKQLFYSLTEGNKKQVTPEKIHFLSLIGNSILSQSENICYLMLFINFIFNANLLSLVLPLSACFYGLLDHPVANIKYWKLLMVYILSVIAAKFIYQLPIFCGSPPYSIFTVENCINSDIIPDILVSRIDYIIGIHKFGGPSSYPKDQGILLGILGDLLVLIALLLHKNYLIKVGLWHYVKTINDIQRNPTFKCKPHELNERERIEIVREDSLEHIDLNQGDFFQNMNTKFQKASKWSINFFYKLVPNYLPPKQRNLDLRKQEEVPYTILNPQQIKPGRDYFSQSFFCLLIILVFNIFFYRSVSGEEDGNIPSVNLQRFSIPQVGILFALLAMMMVERMLYRLRNVNSPNSQVQKNGISKHSLTIKIILHVFFVILVHLKLGFYIPKKNNVVLSRRGSLIFEYLLWMIYFFYSSLQIKYGYPQGPFKPPFTRDTSFLTVLAFRIYKAMPFLWEMKVIVDWTVTSTCLDLFQWFKLDDAFNYLYTNQFQNDDRKNRPEYDQRPWTEKFFQGFCFAIGLILVILAPILLFSGINPIMVKNPVRSTALYLSMEMNSNGNTYEILKSQAFNLEQLKDDDIQQLERLFQPINVQFYPDDLQKMQFSPYSENEWSISPPSLQKFIDDFNYYKDDDNAYVEIKMNYQLKRDNPIGNELSQYDSVIKLKISDFQPIADLLAQNVKSNLNSTDSEDKQGKVESNTILIENMFPKILRLGSTNHAKTLEVIPKTDVQYYTSVNLTLNKEARSGFYWTFKINKDEQDGIFEKNLKDEEYQDMVLVVYNEEVIGSLFGSALQLSVVGLYATIVIAIGRFLRLIFDRMSQRMIYEEMTDTEKLFEICEGIFIAQLEGDLKKEKRLYDLLIRLYRSPETLLKITGTKLHHKQRSKRNAESSESQKVITDE